jgi:hypothetical protein
LLDLALQLGRELGGAVELASAVVLDLLVGLVAVQFGDALAAIDFVGQIVEFGVGASQSPMTLRPARLRESSSIRFLAAS